MVGKMLWRGRTGRRLAPPERETRDRAPCRVRPAFWGRIVVKHNQDVIFVMFMAWTSVTLRMHFWEISRKSARNALRLLKIILKVVKYRYIYSCKRLFKSYAITPGNLLLSIPIVCLHRTVKNEWHSRPRVIVGTVLAAVLCQFDASAL